VWLTAQVAPGPDWAEIVTAVSSGLVALGLLFAGFQVRESRHSRHAAIAVELARQWSDDDLIESRSALTRFDSAQHFCATYKRVRLLDREPGDDYFVTQRVANFFEYLGVMQRFGWVSVDWINETLGSAVLEWWNMWYLAVEYERNRSTQSKNAFKNFEDLAKSIRLQRACESAQPAEAELRMAPRLALAQSLKLVRVSRLVLWKILHKTTPPTPTSIPLPDPPGRLPGPFPQDTRLGQPKP
jgi:hypothetical protein